MHNATDTTEIVIVAGSNVDRERCVPAAIRRLRRHRDIQVRSVSSCYESPSVGGPDDAPDFWNVAILAQTTLDPESLRDELHAIEDDLGRVRTDDPDAPRTIDLDVAYFGDLAKEFDSWAVPDPNTETQAHVAVPIAEVAPDWVHPVTGRTAAVRSLASRDPSRSAAAPHPSLKGRRSSTR